MIHKATELITKTFDEHSVKYRVTEVGEASMVEAGFEVEAGPEVVVRYISNDEDNDVAVRIFGLMHRIQPHKKQFRFRKDFHRPLVQQRQGLLHCGKYEYYCADELC